MFDGRFHVPTALAKVRANAYTFKINQLTATRGPK